MDVVIGLGIVLALLTVLCMLEYIPNKGERLYQVLHLFTKDSPGYQQPYKVMAIEDVRRLRTGDSIWYVDSTSGEVIQGRISLIVHSQHRGSVYVQVETDDLDDGLQRYHSTYYQSGKTYGAWLVEPLTNEER